MTLMINIEDFQASVRIANHHPVTMQMSWERSIPDYQVICFLEGNFEYQEDGAKLIMLSPGDFLFIEPGIRHRLALVPGCEGGSIAGFHLEFHPTLSGASGGYRLAIKPARVTRPEDSSYIKERFIHLAGVYAGYQPYRKALVDSIATEILLLLAAYWEGKVERAARPSQRMEGILAYIREHLNEPLTRQSLAEVFNLSAGYVNQLFKLELGMSPSAVINRERMARAYQLIDRDGLSVTETAQAVGFQDPFYFSRVFKEIYLVPPSQVSSRK